MLPCLTGSWKQSARTAAFDERFLRLQREALEKPELMQTALGRPARRGQHGGIGKSAQRAGRSADQGPVRLQLESAAVCPNHNEVIRGLRRPDLFTAVHEQFFTDTTDYADLVLPATTFFEQKDLQTAYGHYYLQMSDQAIQPLGECRRMWRCLRAAETGI